VTLNVILAAVTFRQAEKPRNRLLNVAPEKPTPAPQAQLRRDWLLPPDIWLARGAVGIVALLQVLVINDLVPGPRLVAPIVELCLLAPLSFATARHQRQARTAVTGHEQARLLRQRRTIRLSALTLTGLLTLINLATLVALVRALVIGQGSDARTLLLDAANVWVTNAIIFALWFWALDDAPAEQRPAEADFIFTQEQSGNAEAFKDWSPGFIDYLFLAFTNATAFSPSDTFPLSRRAKVMMMLESGISFVTIGVVAARAVGLIS
jgi:hypothetical protein